MMDTEDGAGEVQVDPESLKQAQHDLLYFESYGSLDVHELMLKDKARTEVNLNIYTNNNCCQRLFLPSPPLIRIIRSVF